MNKKKKKGGKQAIIRDVMGKGVTARKATKAVNAVFRLMTEALSFEESVEVPGVGTLEVVIQKGQPKRREQKIRNIATKEIEIYDVKFPGRRRVIKLKADPKLKLAVSSPLPAPPDAKFKLPVPPPPSAPPRPKPLSVTRPIPTILHTHRAGLQPSKPRRRL